MHELLAKRPAQGEKEEKDLFGQGKHSHTRVIPGDWNVDKMKEFISIGVPETRIVSTMTRDEILNFEIKENPDNIVDAVANMSPKQKALLLAHLKSDSNDVIDEE